MQLNRSKVPLGLRRYVDHRSKIQPNGHAGEDHQTVRVVAQSELPGPTLG